MRDTKGRPEPLVTARPFDEQGLNRGPRAGSPRAGLARRREPYREHDVGTCPLAFIVTYWDTSVTWAIAPASREP